MTLPSAPVANARALAKARWLLASYMPSYWTAMVGQLGAPYAVRPDWWSVGADLAADPSWRDVQAAVGVTPVASSIVTSPAADGTPFQSQDIRATWSVVCAVNTSTYGLDTAPLAAQLGCLTAMQILTERMADPVEVGVSTVWSCTPLSDAGAPVYPTESAQIAIWRGDVEVALRAQYQRIGTLWPGVGLTPYGVQASINPVVALAITGDATATVAAGASTSISAASYTTGLTLTPGATVLSLTCVNQVTFQSYTVAAGGTVAPANLSAAAGQVWTITGVDDTTKAIHTFFVVWT